MVNGLTSSVDLLSIVLTKRFQMSDLYCGVATFFTTFTLTSYVEDPMTQIWISIVSAIFFALVNVGVKILTSWLENKGIINDHQKHEIDKVADDLTDDGKLNNSNVDKSEKN